MNNQQQANPIHLGTLITDDLKRYPWMPLHFFTALQVVQRRFPEAVLAGGALRDAYIGKPVKDLDIFVSYPNHNALHPLFLIAQCFDMGGVISEQKFTGYAAMNEVAQCFQVVSELFPQPINIVLLNRKIECASDVIDRMDFGICHIGCRGMGQDMVVSDRFFRDMAMRTFTLYRQDDEARAVRRWQRLQDKYEPPWRMVIPHRDDFLKASRANHCVVYPVLHRPCGYSATLGKFIQ